MKKTFTPEEVAALVGVTVPTVIKYIKRKKLKASHRRTYQIQAEDLREFFCDSKQVALE